MKTVMTTVEKMGFQRLLFLCYENKQNKTENTDRTGQHLGRGKWVEEGSRR